MPNDLTAKRNLLNRRADAPTSQRQKLASSGFTASIWTISGVVLAACSSTIEDIEEFLGLDDGGDGGGNALHVQRSPVQGARIYFDMDNDGVIDTDDITAQDEAFPQGFVTDAAGRAHNIPAVFQGLPFKAVLDGAIDADTRAELSGELRSIPNADDDHLLASPITEYIAEQADTAAEVVAEWLGLDTTTPLPPEQERMRDTELRAILTSANYQGGDARIEVLAVYLAHTPSPDQDQITRILIGDTADPDNTLIVVSEDMVSSDAVTIGAHDSYVATIQAVSHAGGVGYRFVDADGEDTTISDFSINAQGVISFIGENPTTTTLHIEVSNGTPSESEIVRVAVTVADAPTLDELPAGDEVGTIMENVAGGSGDGTALITGITTSATNPSWEISEANPAGQSAIADKFEIVSGTGDTFNLVLKAGEILNYDAIPGGVLNLHVWAEVGDNDIRSNALALRIQVEQDPDEVAFSGSFTGIVAEDGNLVAQGTFSVENQGSATATPTDGTYGTLTLADGRWTYTLNNENSEVDGLRAREALIDTATITLSSGESQNILIRINGANEDVHFVDGDGNRITSDVAENGIEIGADAISGVNLGDVVPEIRGLLPSNDDSNVVLADDMGGLFSLDSATGILTFTGTAADIAGLNGGANLVLVLTAPASIGDAEVRLALRVNVINEVDDGRAEYEVTGDVDVGQTLTVSRVQGSDDPDGIVGAVSFQWFRGDETSPTLLGTGDTYRVTQTDIDSSDSIGVFVRYTDGSGTTYTHTDGDPTTTIAAFASPVSFTAPAIADRTIPLDENNVANLAVATVTATSEDDAGATVHIQSFALVDDFGGLFSISTTGAGTASAAASITIADANALDFETTESYTLRVVATDANTPPETATLTLTVNVGDVNDNAPVFTQATYTADIDETLGNGAEVARVSARDDDGTTANNTVGYSITAGNTGNVFDIDDNGVITVLDASALDFETTPSYTLTITATDNGSPAMMDTATVTITVNDINDEPPVVTALAGTIRTTTGNLANTNTGYSITVTDADAEATNDFRVDSDDPRFIFERDGATSTWNLVLLPNQAVSLGDFTLGYTATDGANTDSGTVTISAVDSSVSFDSGFERDYDIPETTSYTAGELVVQVSATSVTPGNPTITYAFEQGNPDNDLFNIDATTGRITWAANTAFDYEALTADERIGQVVVIATEVAGSGDTNAGTGNTARVTITGTVMNEQEGDGTYIIQGNVAAGAELMAVVNDPDGTRSVTYEWYSIDPADNNARTVLGATQSITLPAAADFDDSLTYHVDIVHIDNLGDRHEETLDASAVVFDIQNTDGNAFPSSIVENTDSLPVVVASLDGDTRTATYTFADGTTTSGVFTISQSGSTAGAITVNAPSDINFETAQEFNDGSRGYTLNVRATFAEDTANNLPEVTGDVVVTIIVTDVNEHAPVFVTNADDNTLSTGTDEIAEDAANGTRVGLFRATDADGSNNAVTYSLDDGGLGVFGIQAVDGTNNWEIYVLDNTRLDFESATKSYTIEITASDGAEPAMTTTEAFTINITDANDNDPVLSATPVWEGTLDFGVPENTGTNVHLFTVSATDADENPSLTYEIVSIDGVALASIANPIFGIDASDGRVGLAGQLDRETKASHEIVIRAVDEGGRASEPQTFTVTVGDVNDNKPELQEPVWASDYGDNGVPEDAYTGAPLQIFTATATDRDANNGFSYEIVSVDGVTYDSSTSIFSIHAASGRVGITSALDYETAPEIMDDTNAVIGRGHEIVIVAIDNSGTGMRSEPGTITVLVANADDGNATYAITGDVENNGMLSVAVDTADPDGLVAGTESYRWFILNSDGSVPAAGDTNGDVQDAGSDDGDDSTLKLPADVGSNVYGVVVTYRDNAGEMEEETVIASPLRFASSAVEGMIAENSAETVEVATVTAMLSTNTAAVPTYSLTDASGKFEISASGVITLKSGQTLDFENTPDLTDGSGNKGYVVTVDATTTDAGKTENAPPATVTIIVTDENDTTPVLAAVSDTKTATIAEDHQRGADVGDISFTITDADADTTNNFVSSSFTITAGTGTSAETAAKFEVVKNGDNWDLKVRADDGATPTPNPISLDRETDGILATGVINLDIKVNDGVADSNVIAVEITVTDLNDNPPTSSGESGTATLIEAAAVNTNTDTGYSFTLADKDTDAVNRHEFMILGGESSRFAFVKDGTTANQWNLVLLAGQTVDREMDGASIMLNFQVNDESNRPLTALSTTVAITDANESNPTVAITSIATTQGEQTVAAGGVNVASFAVTDTDATAYARANVELSGDSRFEITGWDAAAKTGMIRLKAGAVLDYETAADRSITLTITATDPLDNSVTDTDTVTITVTDENDNAPTATTSGTASLTEADAVNTNTDTGFSITLADDDTDTVNQHDIRVTGTLATRFGFVKDGTTANQWNLVLLANQKVDREGDGETLTVAYTISDDTNTPITDSVDVSIIDANDEPTVIGATKVLWESPTVSGTIPENSYTAGTEIARAIVRDADVSSNLEYRLTKGGSIFSISNTGIITFTADTDLDADTAPTSYTLAYEVRDRTGAWKSSGDITLTVTDIDDEKPELGTLTWQTGTGSGVTGEEHIRTINEDQGPTPILVMSVSDPDTATASLTPTIQGGSPVDASNNPIFSFGILNNQAILSVLSSRLDHETAPNTYTLTLVVNDGTRTDTETVTINVGDINDNAPDIVVADSTPSVTARTASADTDIITGITVTDADVGKTYAQGDFALAGDSKFKFVWDATAQTGSVVLTSGETIAAGTISLSLTVTDANPVGHAGTDTETLTITVTELVNGGTTGTATQYDPSAADASGTLTYIDAAQVKANPVAGDYTATGTTYGTATVDASGTWTYNVDNTHAMVKGLASGATLTDTFTIGVPLAAGGTGDVDVTVTINPVTTVHEANLDRSSVTAATSRVEVIQGGDGADTIVAGDGGSFIFGGYGNDMITLGDGVDIVVYRFSSLSSGWRADDGADTIVDFEQGKDKLILVDVDTDATSVGSYANFINYDVSGGGSGGAGVSVKPVFRNFTDYKGVEIAFEAAYDDNGPDSGGSPTGTVLSIAYETILDQSAERDKRYIGAGLDGLDANNGYLSSVTAGSNLLEGSGSFALLPNYFNSDSDSTSTGHLDVITLADLAIDVL